MYNNNHKILSGNHSTSSTGPSRLILRSVLKFFDHNWTWPSKISHSANKHDYFLSKSDLVVQGLYLMNTMTTNRSKMLDHPSHGMTRCPTNDHWIMNLVVIGSFTHEPVEKVWSKKIKIFEEFFFRNTLQVICSWHDFFVAWGKNVRLRHPSIQISTNSVKYITCHYF